MKMQFSKIQLGKISDYSMDLSKILFVAVVIDFFFSSSPRQINILSFAIGFVLSLVFLAFGIKILNEQKI